MPRDLPTGTVTLLFTDIQGSTKLLHEIGAEAYAHALARHREVLRAAFARHGGVEVDTEGDAFFIAFPTAPAAVAAAAEAQRELAPGRIRVRMGMHTGTPHVTDEGYVGVDVHKGARIAAAGHGGQVLLSKETQELVNAELTDLGEHRLKDFAGPVWLYQLGTERFPPLKTISNTNLPRPPGSFVGRTRELADLVAAVRNGARLVTLTGPGGSGKTRLAIEAASELLPDFPNGVFWVDLAPLRDTELVVDTIATTLGAGEGLAEHIGRRTMLLVLDNLEQVIGAAPALAAVLPACPNLALMVTSREVLRVAGEVEFPVPPLTEPDAVELFCSRARVPPSDEIRKLCRRLDDLPLAVELAAARAGVLTPAQMLDRLSKRLDLLKGGRDADARQRTLRSTIEWSYDLLDDGERRCFASMAVFAGGCSLEAVEEVTGADLDTLQSLVDKSLVRSNDARFSMLETIREYALERLAESGEAHDIRARHAAYVSALAHEAEPKILDVDPIETLDRLEREHDNIRAALDFLESTGDIQEAMELAGSIWEFWCLRAHNAEGSRRLQRLVADDARPTRPRARALVGAAHLASAAGAGAEIERRLADEAVTLAQRLGDARVSAFAEFQLAWALTGADDFAAARPMMEQSIRRMREIGDEHRALQATRGLAWCYNELGDAARSKTLHQELHDRAHAIGDKQMQARALNSLSSFALTEGRLDDVPGLIREAYRLDREFGDPSDIAVDLLYLVQYLLAKERPVEATQLLARSEAIREEIGVTHPAWIMRMLEPSLGEARAKLGPAAFDEGWERGRAMSTEAAFALALDPRPVTG